MESFTLTAEQRDALYGQILDHLSGIGDVWLAIQREDYETADRIGREFVDELRLVLEDLGWGEGRGGAVQLTLPPEVLRRVLSRVRELAVEQQAAEQREQDEVRAPWERAQLAREACDQVLATLDGRAPRGRDS